MAPAEAFTLSDPVKPKSRASSDARVGLLCGLGAYLAWGAVPLYFKLVTHVPAIVVLAHRIVWSLVFLAIVNSLRRGGWRETRAAVLTRAHVTPLLISTILISVNWYAFIFAVEHDMLLQASLGYFINPLLSVLLGVVVMGERLRVWQIIGIALATAGVAILTLHQGHLPWLSLTIATSFALYGLMRKTMHASAMAGLTVETAILFLPSLAVIIFAHMSESARVPALDARTLGLLMPLGIVTAVPLLMFAAAARRLRLSTMGFMQYISPTSQFLLAVLVFGEPFTRTDLASFSLIWAALFVYTADSFLTYRREGAATRSFDARAKARDDGVEPTA